MSSKLIGFLKAKFNIVDSVIPMVRLTGLLLMATMLVSCSDKPKPQFYIPEESDWIFRADLKWLALELMQMNKDTANIPFEEVGQQSQSSFHRETSPILKIVSNPLNSGINVLGDIWIFSQEVDSLTSISSALVALSSINNFEDRLKEEGIPWHRDKEGLRTAETDHYILEWNSGVLAITYRSNNQDYRQTKHLLSKIPPSNRVEKLAKSKSNSNLYISGRFLSKFLGDGWLNQNFMGSIQPYSQSIQITGQFNGSGPVQDFSELLGENSVHEALRTIPAKSTLHFAGLLSIKSESADSILLKAMTYLGIMDSTDMESTAADLSHLWNGQLQYIRPISHDDDPYMIKAGVKSNSACDQLLKKYYDLGIFSRQESGSYSLAGLYSVSCTGSYLNWGSQKIAQLGFSKTETIESCNAYFFARTNKIIDATWGKADSSYIRLMNDLDLVWIELKIPQTQHKVENTLMIDLTLGFRYDLRSMARHKMMYLSY